MADKLILKSGVKEIEGRGVIHLRASQEKKHLSIKKILFFLLGSNHRPSTALFDTLIHTRYFSLFGSWSGLLSVSSLIRIDPDPHQSSIGIKAGVL